VIWQQHYNPLGHWVLSTLVAAVPVAVLLSSIALWRARIHLAATGSLLLAWAIAVAIYRMPAGAATAAAIFGGAYGLFPIGWIILNLIFLYDFCAEALGPWRQTLVCKSSSSHLRSAHFLRAPLDSARRWQSPARFSSNSASAP
jgi:hypothetical protein